MKQLLRTLILLLARLLGTPGAMRAAHQVRQSIPHAPRILLIRPDHLGDLILTTPVLHALKTCIPEAHITMIVGPWSREVVARHPDIDALLLCPFPGFQRAAQKPLAPYTLLLSMARQLRRDNYDLAINLRPDFWWGAALLYLAQIPRRVGYAIAPGTPFLSRTLPFQQPEHATVSNLRLVSAGLETLGYPPLDEPYTPERYPLQFTPTATEQTWAAEHLVQAGITPTTPIVIIHPGSGAEVKLWRSEAWSICANKLTETSAVRIVLTGAPKELPLLEQVAQGITTTPLLVTDASVGQLAALLQRAQLVLGVDSGPLHLAVAQDTPTVHIYGPADPRIFGPWGTAARHLVIAATQRCPSCPSIPCGRLAIPPGEVAAHPCVRLISEQQVLAAVSQLNVIPDSVQYS